MAPVAVNAPGDWNLTLSVCSSKLGKMKRTRKKLKRLIPIGNRLDTVLAAIRRYADQDLIRVWDLWAAAVGANRAAHTRPAAFKDRLLIVYTDSSAWVHELRFQTDEIISRLNTALEKDLVDDIRFRIGPVGGAEDAVPGGSFEDGDTP